MHLIQIISSLGESVWVCQTKCAEQWPKLRTTVLDFFPYLDQNIYWNGKIQKQTINRYNRVKKEFWLNAAFISATPILDLKLWSFTSHMYTTEAFIPEICSNELESNRIEKLVLFLFFLSWTSVLLSHEAFCRNASLENFASDYFA